jgi:hypothetical protein
VNEPGFHAASKADEFGLWLDEEVEAEPAGIDRTVYGKPSGVLGFRLFPNPDFNEEARKKWNGDRFMNDPSYYNDNKLIRPYRVGVACGSCHIAPNPSNPPLDPENPRWENLASAIGNQYINEGKCSPVTSKRADFSTRCLPRNRAALRIRRGSRQITSTIRMQSMRSSCSVNENGSRRRKSRWRHPGVAL